MSTGVRDIKKILKIIAFSIFFIFIVVYAFFNSRALIFGVKIRDVNITDGATVVDNVLKITGNARNSTSLVLNGREISLDQQGNFDETIILLKGYNVVDIVARDKFGYSDEKIYKLIYNAEVTF